MDSLALRALSPDAVLFDVVQGILHLLLPLNVLESRHQVGNVQFLVLALLQLLQGLSGALVEEDGGVSQHVGIPLVLLLYVTDHRESLLILLLVDVVHNDRVVPLYLLSELNALVNSAMAVQHLEDGVLGLSFLGGH